MGQFPAPFDVSFLNVLTFLGLIRLHEPNVSLSSFLPFTVKQRATVFRRRELIYYILLFVSTPKVKISIIFFNFFYFI